MSLVLVLLSLNPPVSWQNAPQPVAYRETLRRVLSCVVSRDWATDELSALETTKGQFWVAMSVDQIPDISPVKTDETKIVVLSTNRRKGVLFFTGVDARGKTVLVNNSYRLIKDGGHWSAGEGNGGVGTYRAMGKYVDTLRAPYIRMTLPKPSGCAVEG